MRMGSPLPGSLLVAAACVLALLGDATHADRARMGAICSQPVWSADGGQVDGRFGTVAPAGDVNHDGYADVLIGAYNESHPEAGEGRVYLYLGGPGGLAHTPAWSYESDQAGARFGDKLSTAGDVNGDGYDDVINGAGMYDAGQTDEGRAYLHLGSVAGLAPQPAWTMDGNQTGANFGACVQAAGDVNGDGYADVIVGAWLYDHGETDEGAAFVYLGSDTGLARTPAWTGESNSTGAVYGYFCTRAGDLDGDGYEDIVVGARRFSGNGISKEGRVYVYYGSPSGPSTTPGWILDGGQKGGELGTSPAPAGDVNGDGYDDLLVNAPRYDHPNVDEGKVWLYLGSANGLGMVPVWTAEGDQDSAQFGYHMDGAGDVNRDGYDDVIVTAIGDDADGIDDSGAAFLYLGGPGGLSAQPAWIQKGDQLRGELGHATRGVGDVNGDGFADVMTGAIYRDSPLQDCGRAYLFYGCPDGLTSAPVAVPATPRVSLVASSPFTRLARLEYTLPAGGPVTLDVSDVTGRRVAMLVDAEQGPSRHVTTWDGRTLGGHEAPAGVYLARLRSPWGEARARLVRLPRP